MAINFPNAPEIDDVYTYGSKKWKWNGINWAALVEATLISSERWNKISL